MNAIESGAPPPVPSRADAASLPAGHRINEYQIDRPLGGGGFGITYLARDDNLDLPVAIKEYFPNDLALRGPQQSVLVRSSQPEMQKQYDWGLERFLDEARALATFRHPNIVRVLRYFRENGTAYIVMEYESGLSLKRWVPQNAPLGRKAVLSVVRPLLDGLEQVHASGFLHRDIKPDNIYVRADGSPVLLDFGSARRMSTDRDLTNIVSPGFAPFEQYHSQGHQGPWSDIYSLGAVMYWMVTGHKPLESAARVQGDSMLPASRLADAAVYGQGLLEAVDWAMQPKEGQRPQSVAEFRAVLADAGQPADSEQRTQVLPERQSMAGARFAPSMPASAASGTAQRGNLLGTILFLDLVGYSVRSVDDQVAVKKLFNEMVAKAVRGVAEESRIAIDTGDGAAICFMGDPEEALHSALLLRDLLGQRYGAILSVRIGLHMGPVRVVSDINARVNVIGDGINVAQRVMDFAQPNQVLVSRAYFDVISRITDDTAGMFRYLGVREDKHGRPHEVYAVDTGQADNTRPEGAGRHAVPVAEGPLLDEEAVHELEAELARDIGPLARVLVRKALPLAQNLRQLREALAPSIQEPRVRELFLGGHGQPRSTGSRSTPSIPRTSTTLPPAEPAQPRANASQTRASLTQQPPQAAGPVRGAPQQAGHGRPAQTQTMTGFSRVPPVSGRNADLVGAEDMTVLESLLGKSIGPMARILLKQEAARSASLKDLVAALSAHLEQGPQREAFAQAVRKALPRRLL